ncbi:MAG TPA: M50 family metallopeptidase [Acidimicrobiales bacterium]|nr:M50 family metallopeptidase [Acidimicrobiales bacterium]
MTQTSPTPTIDEQVMPDPDVQRAEKRKLAMLAGILVGGVTLSVLTDTFPVVAFCLAMVAVVMLHEAAHFVAAKLSGMKATEFFFGFGPRLWSIRKGETEYGIKAIPLGGYVKIIGMSNLERDIDPADEPRTYRQGSYPKRMAVALAGVTTHFVLAFLLLVLLLSAIGVPNYDKPSLEIGSLSRLDTGASPAVDAGFKVGDRILSVDGRPVANWDDVPPLIRGKAGQRVDFVVERDGRRVDLTAVPTTLESNGETRGFIGIGPKPTVERLGPIAASSRAAEDVWRLTTGSIKALGSFFAPGSLRDYANQLTNAGDESVEPSEDRFVSVVGVARIAGQAAESGAFNVIYLLVLLNIFIGVFNLIPLLPLDGGHVAIATYERIRSRAGRRYQADVGKMMPIAAAVIVVLVLIGVTSIYLDIVQPITNPYQ